MSCDSKHWIIVKNPQTREKVMNLINGITEVPHYEVVVSADGTKWLSFTTPKRSYHCSIDSIEDTEKYLKIELSGELVNTLGCYLYETGDYFIYFDCDEELICGITNDYGREFFQCEVATEDGFTSENINDVIEDCVNNNKWYHITMYDEFDTSVIEHDFK